MTRVVSPRGVLRGPRRRFARRRRDADLLIWVFLVLAVVCIVAVALRWSDALSFSVMVLPLFLGSVLLGPRRMPAFVVVCLLGIATILVANGVHKVRGVVQLVATFLIAMVILLISLRRSRLGVSGVRSESMFVDLQDRITKQGLVPRLPSSWYVDACTRSAGGTSFAGDFVVASASTDARLLELVVVDVSGKGVEAGTRALLLSGAFGGIVSALPAEEFLPAANGYLLRQDWPEGFATAIHLHLDLTTGDFELRKAGHPPAVWLHAGSGKWSVVASEGPVLGLIEDAEFECVRGRLRPGDAILLYTDGLVETPERDINSGIDKLAGRGQLLLHKGVDRGARRVIDDVVATNDDRALVVVHRR